jgi:hypothetical protein
MCPPYESAFPFFSLAVKSMLSDEVDSEVYNVQGCEALPAPFQSSLQKLHLCRYLLFVGIEKAVSISETPSHFLLVVSCSIFGS